MRSSENTISGVRSKNPISRRQLVPHLQWNRPMNCCFILRPQFGQIRLLALIKVYWSLATISSADIPLASSFFNTDSASAFLDSSAAFFFGSNLFCLCFRKFLCCNLQSRLFTFQLFLQCNISIFFLSRNGNTSLDNKSGAFCKAPLLFIEKTTSYACGRKEP